MNRYHKHQVGKAMTALGKALGQPLRQIGAMVGEEAVKAYSKEYINRGFVVVHRSWGAEIYST